MNTSRNIGFIIEQMFQIIPINETKLIEELEKYIHGIFSKSPEQLNRECWIHITYILNKHIKVIDDPWKVQLQQLFNDDTTK